MNYLTRLQRLVFILFVAFAPVVVMTSTAYAADVPAGIPSATEAMTAFQTFAQSAKKFAWLILLIGVIIGAIAWGVFSQQKLAIGVFIGAAILCLGGYIIGIIAAADSGSGF
jgi:hypothetical protein